MSSTIRTTVFCKSKFIGFHRWPDAPVEVSFLRSRHRHLFHVELRVEVNHDDREVEFLLLQKALEEWIQETITNSDTSTWSCEAWCRAMIQIAWFGNYFASYVSVSEDGENGAVLERVAIPRSSSSS